MHSTTGCDLAPHLEVERVGLDRFEGRCVGGAGSRVYGGQVAAHALAAAGRTLGEEAGPPASLHVHFLAPGDTARPIAYHVRRVKDGRSFQVRQVEATQGERVLALAVVAFHAPEPAPTFVAPAPRAAPPADCPPLDAVTMGGSPPAFSPVEARAVARPGDSAPEPALRLWVRPHGVLPADPLAHACALTWMSDLTMTRTVDRPRQHWGGFRQGASLDHTVWFHGAVRADGWLLVDQVSEVYTGARGLARGAWFDEAGARLASTAQDCLIRRPVLRPSES